MRAYSQAMNAPPYTASNVTRLSDRIGTATFFCESAIRTGNIPYWSLGPYIFRCPSEYWLVLLDHVSLPDIPGVEPGDAPFIDSLFCVFKRTAAKQLVRGRPVLKLPYSYDCLDYVMPIKKPQLLVAWATKDDGEVGAEVKGDFFLGKGTEVYQWWHGLVPIGMNYKEYTAWALKPVAPPGSTMTVCYTSTSIFTTVFRLGPRF